jgi:hypothetical protein
MLLSKIEISFVPGQSTRINLLINPDGGATTCTGQFNIDQQCLENLKATAENLRYQVERCNYERG